MRPPRGRGEAPEVGQAFCFRLDLILIVYPHVSACDQCRKTKSKCERLSDTLCTNCVTMDTGEPSPRLVPQMSTSAHIRHSLHFCRFVGDPQWYCLPHIHACLSAGPSYKRGPPKGYINAIEQRMQQFEALIGVILQTSDPRALGLISDLKQDELARSILNRVDIGRFVRRTRFFRSFRPPIG